uniref:Calmodulin-like protein 4 n=1 Tax=Canis lupus dingo TaxID=286419 RepID=A0A8C0QX47_CANLU
RRCGRWNPTRAPGPSPGQRVHHGASPRPADFALEAAGAEERRPWEPQPEPQPQPEPAGDRPTPRWWVGVGVGVGVGAGAGAGAPSLTVFLPPLQAKFLSQDQINEYKECFSLYDKEQRGRIKATDLLVVMRCLGASPTPGEVQRHLQSHKIDRDGELDFSTFLTIMHMQIKQEDPKKEILLAMLMADKEKKGYIMASELRSKLMKLGEKLTHKEVDDLFKEANIEPNGKVKYDEFIHKITIPVWDH